MQFLSPAHLTVIQEHGPKTAPESLRTCWPRLLVKVPEDDPHSEIQILEVGLESPPPPVPEAASAPSAPAATRAPSPPSANSPLPHHRHLPCDFLLHCVVRSAGCSASLFCGTRPGSTLCTAVGF